MMILNNLNLNGLNISDMQNNISSTQNLGIDAFLNELLKILFESKNSNINDDLMVLPAGALPFSLVLQNNQNFSGVLQLDDNVKSELLSLFQNGNLNMEKLSSLLQNIKIMPVSKDFNSINASVIKELPIVKDSNITAKSFTDNSTIVKNETTKELVSMNIDKNSLSLDKGFSVSLPARHETDNSTRVLQFLSDKVEALTNLQHKTDEKNFNDTLSQLNIMHNISNTAPKNPQKIELPVSNIQNLSDIVFKSVSTSQKSITIQLEPPELGKILIRISMDSSGIKADMKVDYPHIKEMITGLIPEIKSNLESRGVKVSDFLLDLTKDHPGYGDSYNGQGQQKYKGNQKFFEYFA